MVPNFNCHSFFFFFGFSMGRNQYWAGRLYDMCVYYMMGTPKGSTESGFMEKPGFEPATPGLQGIALFHYTTGASQLSLFGVLHLSWSSFDEIPNKFFLLDWYRQGILQFLGFVFHCKKQLKPGVLFVGHWQTVKSQIRCSDQNFHW